MPLFENKNVPLKKRHSYLLILFAIGSILIIFFVFLDALLFYRSFKFHSRYDAEESLRFVIARVKGHLELMSFIPNAPSYFNSLSWLDDELHEHPGLHGVIVRENNMELVNTFRDKLETTLEDLSDCENGISRGHIYFICRSVELLPERNFFFIVAIDVIEQLKNFHLLVIIGCIMAVVSFSLFYLSWFQIKRFMEKEEELERRFMASEKLALTGKLAAMIAHEIRNPLNALSMAVQYTQATGEMSPEIVAVIKRETEKLKELSGELFGMQSDFLLGTERFSILPLVMELENKFSEKASALDIDFICEYPSEDVTVTGNRKWLFRAIENLIRNAFEAVSPSVGKIEFRVRINDVAVTFIVHDNGSGILEDDKAMVFEPFYTTKREGIGLGLYIVKKVAEAHGGSVKIESSKEGGTTFILKIPIGANNV